jgi:hypothetical protein
MRFSLPLLSSAGTTRLLRVASTLREAPALTRPQASAAAVLFVFAESRQPKFNKDGYLQDVLAEIARQSGTLYFGSKASNPNQK